MMAYLRGQPEVSFNKEFESLFAVLYDHGEVADCNESACL